MHKWIVVLVISFFLLKLNSSLAESEQIDSMELSSQSDAEFMRSGITFPDGFWWGAATAAHQVEGNLDNDWTQWERVPGNIANGDTSQVGVDHYNRFDEDFALAKAMGHNTHRISIEWSRIEPQRGEFNQEAVEHYHRVFQSMRSHGLRPVVTLHHFTNPKWIAAQGGWLSRQTITDFARFAAFVGLEYGHEVDYWITINEPNIYAVQAYTVGYWPPQHKSINETLEVMANLAHGHIAAYRALHGSDHISAGRDNIECAVGIAHHISIFDPFSWWSPLDHIAAYLSDKLFNRSFLRAVTRGQLNFWYPGAIGVSDYNPDGEGALDFIGVNYYTRWLCRGLDRITNPDALTTAMGWEVYPEGIYRALKIANRFTRYPNGKKIPVLITENGMDDRNGDYRSVYLVQHLKQVARAMREGVKVLGYVHWTLMDNFEWSAGYAPHFGLYSVDRAPGGNLRRDPKPTVEVFRKIAELNGITKDMLDRHSRFPTR
jgi:beta-glucosidase